MNGISKIHESSDDDDAAIAEIQKNLDNLSQIRTKRNNFNIYKFPSSITLF